jgi:IS4 transposase
VFDRGYFDLARLYRINVFGAFFIIREKGKPAFEIADGESILDGADSVLKDQSIRFTKKENQEKYSGVIRRIVYYAPELRRSFVYYTNNFYLAAKDIALLYKYRWQVELFFKWIKQPDFVTLF